MKLTITIELDNAAFTEPESGDAYVGPEVARILHAYAGKVADAHTAWELDGFTLRADGNTVGATAVSED